MKNTPLLRLCAIVATLAFHSSLGATTDAAAHLLAAHGTLPVQAAGPYVEHGTFRVQVSAKLGRPQATLGADTWFYPNYRVDGSNARGTLIVRFRQDRVSELLVVTPAVAVAMRDAERRPAATERLARK